MLLMVWSSSQSSICTLSIETGGMASHQGEGVATPQMMCSWDVRIPGLCLKRSPSLAHIEAVAFPILLSTLTVNPIQYTTSLSFLPGSLEDTGSCWRVLPGLKLVLQPWSLKILQSSSYNPDIGEGYEEGCLTLLAVGVVTGLYRSWTLDQGPVQIAEVWELCSCALLPCLCLPPPWSLCRNGDAGFGSIPGCVLAGWFNSKLRYLWVRVSFR